MHRRQLLQTLAMLAGPAITGTHTALAQDGAAPPISLEVWKDPDCGCCEDWVKHLQANGFAVRVHAGGNSAARARLGVPAALGSCHTGQVAGYAIEGHVPAREIRRLLKDKPQAVGLAVPGMPVGSPGMDGAVYGARRDAYEVLLIAPGGSSRVYQRYPGSRAA